MATTTEPLLRQRFCCDDGCRQAFYICRSCDRGQRYCSEECHERSRRRQRRQANRLHQLSPEGRLDHRDRQRLYRQRLRESVTDQGSEESSSSVTVSIVVSSDEGQDVLASQEGFEYPPRCRICFRRSRWLEMESW